MTDREIETRITDQQVIKTRNDAEMIHRPHLWPLQPYLPVKHRTRLDANRLRLTGVITENAPTRILLGCIGVTNLSTAPEQNYATVEELVADGWLVD